MSSERSSEGGPSRSSSINLKKVPSAESGRRSSGQHGRNRSASVRFADEQNSRDVQPSRRDVGGGDQRRVSSGRSDKEQAGIGEKQY